MRTENIDIFAVPKAKPPQAALRPGGDPSKGGAPGEARQARERFQLPDEALQARQASQAGQDQAGSRRADARADEVRRNIDRSADRNTERSDRASERGSEDEAGLRARRLGRDDAPGRQVMRDVLEKRGVDAQSWSLAAAPEEVDPELTNPDAASEPSKQASGGEGVVVSVAGEGLGDVVGDGGRELTEATDAQDGVSVSQPENEAGDAGLGEDGETPVAETPVAETPAVEITAAEVAAVADTTDPEAATASPAPVASLLVKAEPGMSEAGRARRGEAMAARSGAPSGSAPGLAVSSAMAQQNSEKVASSSPASAALADEPAPDPASGEPAADATGEGEGAAVLDDPGLRRALGQLGLAAPAQAVPGQAAAAQVTPAQVMPEQATPAQAATPAADKGQALAQAVLGELAQSNPAASQQGLAQALSGLAEAAGKAAPVAPPVTVPTAPVVPNVPLGAVPIEIGLKALAGVNHFQIRLDPAELGRIDVRLEIETDGTVKAKLTVDRAETLSLLQRDARMLERAFEQAGLKPSDSGVDLSLRDQGREDRRGEPERGQRDDPRPNERGGGEREAKQAEPLVAQRTIWRGAAGIDVRI